MENQCTVQVKLELGHRAQLRKKVTSEGFTHDWMVFVRGPETGDIQHFVEKVVFRLHESFPKPKRVCKEPPYKVEESGYAGFLMPIEVYFKNKEEPKKVCFNYDLFLNLEGNPPVNHLRCEKLTFNNPTKEFRRKLIKAGGVLVVPEGAEAMSRPSPDYPMLPTIPLSAFSDPKKTKTSHVSKEPSKEGSGGSSKGPKPHKLTKEHRERPRKDSESKAASKGDNDRDGSSKPGRDPSSSSSSKKPSDIKVKDEVKVLPKAAFKEPKITLKDSKMEGMSPKGGGAGSGGGGGGGGGGGPPEPKAPGKRPSTVESPKPSAKKQKKASSEGPKGPTGSGAFTGTSPRVSSSSAANQSYAEKKPPKEKGRWFPSKNDTQELKEAKKLQDSEESNSEDEASSKSEPSVPSSPSTQSSSSDSSSDSDFEPGQKQGQGPLRSMVEEIQSEESDDDDSTSEEETPIKTNPPNRDSRLSLDSESDSSDGSHRPSRDPAPPPQKHSSSNNKVSVRKSPDSSFRSEKVMKKGYDKVGRAYTEELVDLHRRLMALRERNVLQQIVNLIEETGHFNVTNTTFDFDLFSLDESTVRKLQSYLEATT
ncbi:protein ENL isoform X1 [Maylandia zebra]|uniref:Protein ENL isoform X1 n=1 Tax=Pundamilia nyererei TaxID=303518 RepID=A0A9Y6M4J5_9CICH|nr:PREDICTED: protein ENL isoform X1 [Pundamilia nyererei]XP_014194300.1 protein ENL isoform X1 [Haplochromis burtoni]XP_039891055.1 protein ENL isoform X1 [Simochromis diagramma]XP_042083279.1 protein ENL isoform X1 [Haplochromis burtoni]